MKKGQIIEGVVTEVLFPNKGIVETEEGIVTVKNVLPSQKVRVVVQKKRKGRCEGRLLEVLEPAPEELETPQCPHFGECGGCAYQNLAYETQLELKERQVRRLLDGVLPEGEYLFEGVKPSPRQFAYRNKMEFTFGDSFKDGPLALGMHKRGSFYDIVTVENCRIVDEDYRKILRCVRDYFEEKHISFYHRMRHTGYLRHLLVRKAVRTEEILIDLVTASPEALLLADFGGEALPQVSEEQHSEAVRVERELLDGLTDRLRALELLGNFAGILHTKNDSVADVIKDEGTEILYGNDYFYEELLGLKFQISPFSFFQTNSLGAELLYETARDYIGDTLDQKADKVVFDLYSGTGTIAQMLSPVAKRVVGVEIVEEAVCAARENAKRNGLTNCEFIAGDVLKVLDEILDRPDFIVLDPPRDGIHPKALEKIIAYGVERMVYISCKPTSLVRDLEKLQEHGYAVERACCVDMFPGSHHIEVVVLLSHKKPDTTISGKSGFWRG
ncbi:MAG: class I SAM-dependent RNA methyltransferase [Lachnospiraceae bacterium]|nr:class I SAM-dependent RNA methyltransferase [Lachnospiraceae bacterium]